MKELPYNEIRITNDLAEKICSDLYAIQGGATQLPGEIDFNFKIRVSESESYVLKISRPGENREFLDFQLSLLTHLEQFKESIEAPVAIEDIAGMKISEFQDASGRKRLVRLLKWIPGRLYSQVNPQRDALRFSLGKQGGALTRSLLDFNHPLAHRTFDWDIAFSLWTEKYTYLFKDDQKKIVSYFQQGFSDGLSNFKRLRKSVVHNDANDNNILVSYALKDPEVIAFIDYGDAVYTQTINDLAICCAYGMMHQNDPLGALVPIVTGYNKSIQLVEEELRHLYWAIAMRLVITVTKSAINQVDEPDNKYLQISEKPAWEVLEKWKELSEDFVHYTFRSACGFAAHPKQEMFVTWCKQQQINISQLFPSEKKAACTSVDLSVSGKWLGHMSDFGDFDLFQFKIDRLQKEHPQKIIAGGYMEPRMVYSTSAYDRLGNNGNESRTVHLGIDCWLPAGTPVHALLDGEIVTAINDEGDKEYGGLIILKHETDQFHFYSLYGHLSVKSATARKIGERVKKGERIAFLGDFPENGNWPPHLHFELMLSMLDYTDDFPGVAYKSEIEVWKSICPDPNLLFKEASLVPEIKVSDSELIHYRKNHLGKGLSLSYDEPLQMVRGMGAYLIDSWGRKYLDTVNNVAHAGHEHPEVVRAGQEQMALINTNTRYLHENINILARELLETFPPELCVVHFVNSGSEANELALRMAKVVTKQQDILASQIGYHGNTNACIEVSSYKFDGKGGAGCPEHTHLFPLPDAFRGRYRGENAGTFYADAVKDQIEHIQKLGRSPAALIIEPIISCGGQIPLPEGFLALAFAHTRNAGGLCIADEVQVGCGRMGKTFWAFELHGVVPDIVTIGKPLGNGHPIAAVVCTREIADKFANGMEYFNTFGGNPVSCAIATAVLQTVKREGLQDNALKVGNFLKTALKQLAQEFPILADIRGQGLFLGIELNDEQLNPLPDQARYLVNRMKDHGILMSLDGPDHNVLKIKPPMVFSKDNAINLLDRLKFILKEDYMNLKNIKK